MFDSAMTIGARKLIRRVARALMCVGTLAALTGALTPMTVQAVPSGPPDPTGCTKQTVTGDQAELLGYLYVVDPPMVSLPATIRMSGAAIQLPDPNCDGRFLTFLDPVAGWVIATRPAGGSGSLTQVTRSEARLIADRPGQWSVGYTACPNNCRLANVTVPPLSSTVSLNAIPVVEGHLNGTELRTGLIPLLQDSRIQISQTNNGIPVPCNPVTYTTRWSVPPYKYNQLCVEPPQPAPICAQWENGGQGEFTFHNYTPILTSYVDFGPNAVAAGAPDVLPLPIPEIERDVPLALRTLIMGGQPASILYGLDVDRVRVLVNDVHLDLNDTANWSVRIENAGLTVAVKLQSSHPAIKCVGHYSAKSFYVFTVSEGWADELCPDFDLSQMDLSIKFIPGASNDLLTVTDAQVSVQLEPTGTSSEVIDFLGGITTSAEEQIASTMRTKLLEPQTRAQMAKLLTRGLQAQFPDMCKVVTAQVIGTDLVVRFTTPLQPGLLCPGGVYHQ
jgi:uncharacterized protein YbcI